MANRYWVGGTDNWNGTAGSKWATTSGGAGGAAIPTQSDDVFFDANSGAVTVTLVGSAGAAQSFNCTGFTGTLAGAGGQNFLIGNNGTGTGNVTFSATMTMTYTGDIQFGNGTGSGQLTTNGLVCTCNFNQGNGGTTMTLQDNLVTSGKLLMNGGTFTANNKNVTIQAMDGTSAFNTTLNMGTGTWTLTGTGTVWSYVGATAPTNNASTSTIKITDTSNTAITFAGTSKTYNNIWWARGASTATNTITGTNTFADFKDTGTAAHTIIFPNVTTVISTWNVSGTVGNLITLARTGGSGVFTLSDVSGANQSQYLSISNSVATGGATWDAGSTSTNGGGNTGWTFATAPGGLTNASFLLNMI